MKKSPNRQGHAKENQTVSAPDRTPLNHVGTRIKYALTERGMTQAQLARSLGIKQQTISWLCRDGVAATSSRYLQKIAAALGVNPVWLYDGKGDPHDPMVNITYSDASTHVSVARAPLLAHNDVAAHCQGKLEKAVAWLFTDAADQASNPFAVELTDHSMSPAFSRGDRVVFNPMLFAQPGDCVIIKYGNDILFRRYRIKSQDSFEIAPANTDWPTILITGKGEVLGVMVEHRSYPRQTK